MDRYAEWRSYKGNGKAWDLDVEMPDWDDPRPLATRLDEYKARARAGDGNAAYMLYGDLGMCALFIDDPGRIHDEKSGTREEIREAIRWNNHIEKMLKFCKDVGISDLNSSAHWLEVAADLGNPMARIVLADSLDRLIGGVRQAIRDPDMVKQLKDKAVIYLNELASQCNINAISSLAIDYRDGWLFEKNGVTAMSYYMVLDKIGVPRPSGNLPKIAESEFISAEKKADIFFSRNCL